MSRRCRDQNEKLSTRTAVPVGFQDDIDTAMRRLKNVADKKQRRAVWKKFSRMIAGRVFSPSARTCTAYRVDVRYYTRCKGTITSRVGRLMYRKTHVLLRPRHCVVIAQAQGCRPRCWRSMSISFDGVETDSTHRKCVQTQYKGNLTESIRVRLMVKRLKNRSTDNVRNATSHVRRATGVQRQIVTLNEKNDFERCSKLVSKFISHNDNNIYSSDFGGII